MEEAKKRTDRKSRSEKGSSRVVDMSWAAKYLDDDWENKYSAEGACDTRVALPAGERKSETDEDSRAEQNRKPDLSDTQRFKALNADMFPDREEDDVRISDALTDETIASVEEYGKGDEVEDDSIRIRDAVTDQTVANVADAKVVRTALFQMGFDEDLDELTGLRDARSNLFAKTASANAAATTVAETAAPAEPMEPVQKEKPEEPAKKADPAATIVASKESENVRKAASETIDLESFVVDEEPKARKKSRDKQKKKDKEPEKKAVQRKRQTEERQERRPVYREDDYDDDRYYDRRRYRYDDYEERYQYEYMPSKSPLRFIPLVLVIALCVFGFIAAREICHDVPLNSSDYSKVKYTVTAGLTDEQLAQDLESMGIIDNQLIFRIRCIFYSADYVEGTYELSPCYSTEKIINILSGYTYGGDD